MDEYEIISEGFTSEEMEDITRGLNNLYSTRAGSAPMDRSFGITYTGIVGSSPEVAKNLLTIEIINKTKTYEPRVEVDYINYDYDPLNGIVKPLIHIRKAW